MYSLNQSVRESSLVSIFLDYIQANKNEEIQTVYKRNTKINNPDLIEFKDQPLRCSLLIANMLNITTIKFLAQQKKIIYKCLEDEDLTLLKKMRIKQRIAFFEKYDIILIEQSKINTLNAICKQK